mmetsp:Transcript_120177/g.268594  ORF Transcript_120177/g.268594 Transcript_120177/m.268594 type:complete len:296 (-) Transcript_120177:105-992(-)
MRLRLRARCRSHWRTAFSSSGKWSSSTSASSSTVFSSDTAPSTSRSSPSRAGSRRTESAVDGASTSRDTSAMRWPGVLSFSSPTTAPSSPESLGSCCSSPEPPPFPGLVPVRPSARRPLPSAVRKPLPGEALRGGSRFQGARRKGKPRPPAERCCTTALSSPPSVSPAPARSAFRGSSLPALTSSACGVPLTSPATSPSTSAVALAARATFRSSRSLLSSDAKPSVVAEVVAPSPMGASPWCCTGCWRDPPVEGRVRLWTLPSRLLDLRRKEGQAELSFSLLRPTRPSREAARSA